MSYGKHPKELGLFECDCLEMLFYQYLPIKLIGQAEPKMEERLKCFSEIIGAACCNFIGIFGLDRYVNSYVYVTAKCMFQKSGYSFNREGYHSDGFMTEDINYVWCDKQPTVFNSTKFILSQDDCLSLTEMEIQAKEENEFTHAENTLLRLDQFNIHKVAEIKDIGLRTFLKVSISKDRYDLKGNSHNYLLDYDWQMKTRKIERNIPQSLNDAT